MNIRIPPKAWPCYLSAWARPSGRRSGKSKSRELAVEVDEVVTTTDGTTWIRTMSRRTFCGNSRVVPRAGDEVARDSDDETYLRAAQMSMWGLATSHGPLMMLHAISSFTTRRISARRTTCVIDTEGIDKVPGRCSRGRSRRTCVLPPCL